MHVDPAQLGWLPYARRLRVARDTGAGVCTLLLAVPEGSILAIDHLVLRGDNIAVATTVDVDMEAPDAVALAPILDATSFDNATIPLGPVFPTTLGAATLKSQGAQFVLHSGMQIRIATSVVNYAAGEGFDLDVIGWYYGAAPSASAPTADTLLTQTDYRDM